MLVGILGILRVEYTHTHTDPVETNFFVYSKLYCVILCRAVLSFVALGV